MVPVPLSPVPVSVPPSRKSPVAKWYRYQHVTFARFKQNSNFGARVHSSFDHQFEITKEKGIKAKGKVERASLGILGFWFHKKKVFSHSFAKVHRVE